MMVFFGVIRHIKPRNEQTYECQNVTLAHIPFVDFSSYRMNVSFQGFEDTYGQIEQMQFIVRVVPCIATPILTRGKTKLVADAL